MVQVPVATPVTVLPETVQVKGVLLLKTTPRPELAVALALLLPRTAKVFGVKLMAPMLWASGMKVHCAYRVTLAPPMLNVCPTA
jgi:hypothetical protein